MITELARRAFEIRPHGAVGGDADEIELRHLRHHDLEDVSITIEIRSTGWTSRTLDGLHRFTRIDLVSDCAGHFCLIYRCSAGAVHEAAGTFSGLHTVPATYGLSSLSSQNARRQPPQE